MKKLIALLILFSLVSTPAWAARDFTSASSESINLGDSDAFTFGNGSGTDQPFSISAWIRLTDFSVAHVFASKYDATVPNNYTEYNFIYSGSLIGFNAYTTNYQTVIYVGRTCPFTSGNYLNAWVHLAGTYDGSKTNGGFKIYVNAVQVDDTDLGSGSYSGTGMSNTTSVVYLGRRVQAASNLYFQGQEANFRIYNIELTADQVKMDMFDIPVRPDKIVTNNPLWGVSSPEPDISGNANHGTLTGTTRFDHPPNIVGEWQ